MKEPKTIIELDSYLSNEEKRELGEYIKQKYTSSIEIYDGNNYDSQFTDDVYDIKFKQLANENR